MKLNRLSTRDGTGRQDDMASQIAGRLQEINERGGLKREYTVVSVDVEKRTAELSFSSEVEVPRWFGIEVLDHTPGAADLSRLQNKAPLLWNHDWDEQRGVVESASIDADRKGRAVVRLSRSDDGEELLRDMADGIITKVSVGYKVTGMRWMEEREDTDVYLVTSWMPYEISMVSVPADDTVGVGRSAENPREEPRRKPQQNERISNTPTPVRTDQPMHIKIVRNAAGDLVRAEVDDEGNILKVLETLEKAGEGAQAARNAGTDAERSRVRAITDLGKQYDATDLALEFIGSGKPAEEFQRSLLDHVVKNRGSQKPLAEQERNANIGLTDGEAQRYSLMNVVRALTNPHDANAQKAAAFEIDCSRAAAKAYGKEARGIIIPQDVLGRAFNAGGAANTPTGSTTGSQLVANELLSGSFIEMLRNRTTAMRLATVMGGLVGTIDIPKQTGGATGYWIGEGENAQEGVPSIGQISAAPKTVAAYTDITRRLMMQSTPDAEGIVRRDLLNALAQTIDKAAYYGSGTGNEPRGIKNYTGLNAVDFAAQWPTFAELVQMESEVAADNADVNSMGYVGNARFRGHCKTTTKFGAGTSGTIWEQGGTVNGYRAEITNQIANGDVFHGNFADFVIAMWGGLDMTVDPYSLSKSGGLRIVVFQDVDFMLRRVESLCYGSATVTP